MEESLIEFEVENGNVAMPSIQNSLQVAVPNTLGEKSTFLVAVAMLWICLGIGFIIHVKKNKI